LLGLTDGDFEGDTLGLFDGDALGEADGDVLGDDEGDLDGDLLGSQTGPRASTCTSLVDLVFRLGRRCVGDVAMMGFQLIVSWSKQVLLDALELRGATGIWLIPETR
jgi:hypothetical protein